MGKQILSLDEIKEIYNKELATNYDFSLLLFRLLGFRVKSYRKIAIDSLNLRIGDTVVDLGCGTGLNFALIKEKIGREGTIIGVDLSESMLNQAKNRVKKAGWQNINLIQDDISDYRFPAETDAILSTLAISMSKDYDKIIRRASEMLDEGKRMAVFELKRPERWPDWLVQAMIKLLSVYGTRPAHAKRKPWVSIQNHFPQSKFREFYFGAVYIAQGEA